MTVRAHIALLSLCWSCQLLAGDDQFSLVALYDASRLNDATYQVADHDYEASRQEIAIGRSGLLPQVAINSRYGHGGQFEKQSPANGQDDQFASDSVALSVSQPLYNKGRWASYEQAKARAKLGEEQHEGAGQGLFDRVVEAYFDIAQVENELKLTTQQKASIEALAKQSSRLFEAGEGTITDLEEAQARLDLTRAQEIELQARRRAALRKLSGRSGITVGNIPEMQEKLPATVLLAPEEDLDYWMLKAEQAGSKLGVSRASIDVAEANWKLQQSGHYPTVALSGRLSRVGQSDVNDLSQRQSTYYLGVVIDIPLYQGGGVSASSEKARAALESARSSYDAQRQQMAEDIEGNYLGVVAGFEKSKALVTAVRSSQVALTSAEKGYQAGVRSTVEILDAQQRLYSAKRDLLDTKLAMLQSYVNLQTRTGQMTRSQLEKIQGLL
ncbi:TolC family outer membrane protein [Pseudomonas sp. BBP2017]|uniref:TolC family outer membrane protein n=1 Tax=Pseudomonas sp. BBP2017 TaxID=2109731 RepID=UPI000D12C953|nr:TolC family outer membrane protein [Pseudomonas sp. BBP2017]PSS47902.1 ABC transporter [Pseudomonas sp. BBP2017]